MIDQFYCLRSCHSGRRNLNKLQSSKHTGILFPGQQVEFRFGEINVHILQICELRLVEFSQKISRQLPSALYFKGGFGGTCRLHCILLLLVFCCLKLKFRCFWKCFGKTFITYFLVTITLKFCVYNEIFLFANRQKAKIQIIFISNSLL